MLPSLIMANFESEKVDPELTKPAEDDENTAAIRAVAFHDENDIHEDKPTGAMRPKGVEMKRTLTVEDKELSAAGYDHLDQPPKHGPQGADAAQVDIQEHRLSFGALADDLNTSIDTKDAGSSLGLTSDEAKASFYNTYLLLVVLNVSRVPPLSRRGSSATVQMSSPHRRRDRPSDRFDFFHLTPISLD